MRYRMRVDYVAGSGRIFYRIERRRLWCWWETISGLLDKDHAESALAKLRAEGEA